MKRKLSILLLLLITISTNAQWIIQRHDENVIDGVSEGTVSVDFIDKLNGWVVAGNKNYLLHTTDGGESWSQVQTFTNVRKVKFFDNNTGIILKEPDQFYKTTDGGQTWNLTLNYYWARNLFFLNKEIGWAIFDWSLFSTTDGGSTWKKLIDNDVLSGYITNFFAIDNNTLWMVQGNKLCNSIDGGLTWQKGTEIVTELFYYNVKFGWKLVGNDLYKTLDGGVAWNKIFQAPNDWTRIRKIQFINQNVGYCIKSVLSNPKVICKTVDGGITWQELSFYEARTEFQIYDYDIVDEENLWFVGFYGTIAKHNTQKIIDLKNPIGGEVFFINRDYKINWVAYNLDNEKAKIELSRDAGKNWETIKDSVDLVESSANWHVNKYTTNSTNCKIKITHLNSSTADSSENPFSVYASGCLRIKYPEGSELFYGNTQIQIKWDADYVSASPLLIEYYTSTDTIQNNFKLFYTYKSTVSNGQFETLLPYGNVFCKIKIYDANEPYIYTESKIFRIKDKPSLTLSTTYNNWIFPADSIRQINFTSTNVGTIKGLISYDDGINWEDQFKLINIDSVGTKELNFLWKVPHVQSKKCRLKIVDNYDPTNSAIAITETFEITTKGIVGEFPLKTGNRWFYKNAGWNGIGSTYNYNSFVITMVAQIEGETLKPDNKKYFLLDQFSWPPDSLNNVKLLRQLFFRQYLNKVFQYVDENNAPQWFDFETGASISNTLGRDLRTFSNYSSWLFADSIGFSILNSTSTAYYGSRDYLVGCIIDNKAYGEILSFDNYSGSRLIYPANSSGINSDMINFRWSKQKSASHYKLIVQEKQIDYYTQRVSYNNFLESVVNDTMYATTINKKEYRWKVLTYYGDFFISSDVFYFNKIATSIEKEITHEFALHQNYPNPFNPETTINYSIPKSEHVTLKVYDLLGREVATLVDEFKQAGTYNSKLNTQNYKLTSGVYFYRLQSGSYSETKKLILVK